MTNQATMTTTMKRMMVLVAVMMAALMALSTLAAPDAEAKKKKNKPKVQFNTVQCPTEGEDSDVCNGTLANDFLIGGPEDRPQGAFDNIFGGEGTDVYNGGNGSDSLIDSSTTSSDFYLFPATAFSSEFGGAATFLDDDGGGSDIVGLGSYSIDDFEVSREGSFLILDGPEERDILIFSFFGEGEIEYFSFSGGLVTGDELASGL